MAFLNMAQQWPAPAELVRLVLADRKSKSTKRTFRRNAQSIRGRYERLLGHRQQAFALCKRVKSPSGAATDTPARTFGKMGGQ